MTAIKLNPEAKALWCEALRSGKYKQSQGCLKDSDGFCCLGVAEDIFVGGWQNRFSDPSSFKSGEGAMTICSIKTAKILGFEIDKERYLDQYAEASESFVIVPEVTIRGATRTLWNHNDITRASFEEIADAIEEQL